MGKRYLSLKVFIQFRFKCTKMPLVEYFCQTANIPGISLGSAIVPTSMYDYPVPGDNISYQSFDISFLVDENLNNYKELHDWISGLGFPKNHEQFANLQGSGSDRFPGTTSSTAATGTIRKSTAAGVCKCITILSFLQKSCSTRFKAIGFTFQVSPLI